MKLLHLSSSYALPVLVSVALHAVLFGFVFWGWEASSTPKQITIPKSIQATIVQMESSAPTPAAAPQPAQRTIDVAAQRAEAERQRQAEARRRQEQQRQQTERAERERQEQERREQERREQERREQERRAAEQRAQEERDAEQRRMQEALAAELEAERSQLDAQQSEATAASYSTLVQERVVNNWSRPPSARNDMVTELQIQLVPTGRVVGVTIIKSSGDSAFDRSAERAVWRAEQFPELQQVPSIVFEQHFRQFTLRFNPQDLRQ